MSKAQSKWNAQQTIYNHRHQVKVQNQIKAQQYVDCLDAMVRDKPKAQAVDANGWFTDYDPDKDPVPIHNPATDRAVIGGTRIKASTVLGMMVSGYKPLDTKTIRRNLVLLKAHIKVTDRKIMLQADAIKSALKEGRSIERELKHISDQLKAMTGKLQPKTEPTRADPKPTKPAAEKKDTPSFFSHGYDYKGRHVSMTHAEYCEYQHQKYVNNKEYYAERNRRKYYEDRGLPVPEKGEKQKMMVVDGVEMSRQNGGRILMHRKKLSDIEKIHQRSITMNAKFYWSWFKL